MSLQQIRQANLAAVFVARKQLPISGSARKFDELIADGRMPKPKRIDDVVVWPRDFEGVWR